MSIQWRCPGGGIAGCLVIAVLALSAAAWQGRSGRMFAPARVVAVRDTRADALDVWNANRVRGRILVHFDRRIAMSDAPQAGAVDSVLYRAVQANVVRRIHHVVADAAWPEIRQRLDGYRGASIRDDSIRVTMEGMPIVITRLRDLPRIDEPVLVTIDGDDWSAEESRAIVERLREGAMTSDVVVAYGAGAAALAARLEGAR